MSSRLTSSFIPWILMFALLEYCSWSSIFVSSLFIVVSSVAILASFVARCSVNCSSFVVSISNLFAISCGYSNCLSSFSTCSSFNSSIIRRASPVSLASLAFRWHQAFRLACFACVASAWLWRGGKRCVSNANKSFRCDRRRISGRFCSRSRFTAQGPNED